MDSGWYWASQYTADNDDIAVHPKKKQRLLTDPPVLYAWAPPTQQIPTTVHIPFWSKKPTHGVTTKTMVEQLLQQLEQQRSQPAIEPVPATPPSSERAQSAGPPPRSQQGGGGWMNKCVRLMAMVFDGSHEDAAHFSADCVVANQTAFELVHRTTRICIVKHICWIPSLEQMCFCIIAHCDLASS